MALRTPAFNDARSYGFEWLRLQAELGLQEGVIGANDFKATAAAAGLLRVDIAAGIAVVKGETGVPGTGLSHGLWTIVNDASVANAVTLPAAHATLPTIHQVILGVRDTSDLGSPADDSIFEFVAGAVPTAGATLDNRAGAPNLPNDAIRIADVLVPPATTVVSAGNIRDRRPWARGASSIVDTTVQAIGSVNTWTDIGPARRIENTTGLLRFQWGCNQWNANIANITMAFAVWIDGAQAVTFRHSQPSTIDTPQIAGYSGIHGIAPGSKLIVPRVLQGTGGNFMDVDPGSFSVEEIMRPQTHNT